MCTVFPVIAKHQFTRTKASLLITGLLLLPSITVAGSTSWAYANYAHGSYVPLTGVFHEAVYPLRSSGQYATKISFALTATNVASILDYNNGGNNPHPNCDNVRGYLTLDQTAKPNNIADIEIDGYAVTSNLPDPKTDREINYVGVDHDELEVVATGAVKTGMTYSMWTYWSDFRDGGVFDGGQIQAQFAISEPPFPGGSDYNNCTQASGATPADGVQIINLYGKNYGDL